MSQDRDTDADRHSDRDSGFDSSPNGVAAVRDRLRRGIAALHPRRQPPERLLAVAIALAAGVAVYWLSLDLFPHLSANHDEGVYLQQAAMLLEGRLALDAGPIADAVRPWFFVQDGGRLYPKYQPYPAALYAIPMGLLGAPRLALAFTAAANAFLVYVLGSQAFDRRVGVVASVGYATAPMTLLSSAVFLPYAPTATLTLAFAVLYVRALRTGRVRDALLAGGAIGLAFFARPFTAVLFAAPFVAHAALQVASTLRSQVARAGGVASGGVGAGGIGPGLRAAVLDRPLPDALRRNLATGTVGLGFVGLALAYNLRTTGAALRFPFAAFAPRDGPGFGHREIAGHSVEYTPALAVEANAHVLLELLTLWGPGGPIGSLLALVGIAIAARGWWRRWRASGSLDRPASDSVDRQASGSGERPPSGSTKGARGWPGERWPAGTTLQVLLAGLFVSIAVGNVAFWGNYNVLATLDDPTDGLASLFGPFYHFDLLAPLAIFAAAGLVGAWRRIAAWEPAESGLRGSSATVVDRIVGDGAVLSGRQLRAIGFAAVLLTALAGGAASATLLGPPVDRNAEFTERYEAAYEPFEDNDLANAVVLVPTPYGDWMNHPFQQLRNDGGLDRSVVYALDRHPASDRRVLERYPDRSYYRYTYRGEWQAGGEPVEAALQPVDLRRGERLAGGANLGVPDRVSHATVRLEANGEARTVPVRELGDAIRVNWTLTSDSVALAGVQGNATAANGSGAPIPIDDADEVALQVRLVAIEGATMTYRQEVTVWRDGGEVVAIWPPERTVCTLVDDCGYEGTYLPNDPEAYPGGTSFEVWLRADSGA